MVETSDDPSLVDRIRSSAHALLRPEKKRRDSIPLSKSSTCDKHAAGTLPINTVRHNDDGRQPSVSPEGRRDSPQDAFPSSPLPLFEQDGAQAATVETQQKLKWPIRFFLTCKDILLSSWVNVLLVFVPVGIATNYAGRLKKNELSERGHG